MDLLRPQVIVELGTYTGVSYCAFCQAVQAVGLETHCFAVDTWTGDAQSGFYDSEVLHDLRKHHDPLYGEFSWLVQNTFDEVQPNFGNGSIDLLHIDGFHTYEAAKHDFESWLPKVSDYGVVLLHDIDIRIPGYGVWLLWEELTNQFQHFSFAHGCGLGVLAVGKHAPDLMRELLDLTPTEASHVQLFFTQLGRRISLQYERDSLAAAP